MILFFFSFKWIQHDKILIFKKFLIPFIWTFRVSGTWKWNFLNNCLCTIFLLFLTVVAQIERHRFFTIPISVSSSFLFYKNRTIGIKWEFRNFNFLKIKNARYFYLIYFEIVSSLIQFLCLQHPYRQFAVARRQMGQRRSGWAATDS